MLDRKTKPKKAFKLTVRYEHLEFELVTKPELYKGNICLIISFLGNRSFHNKKGSMKTDLYISYIIMLYINIYNFYYIFHI